MTKRNEERCFYCKRGEPCPMPTSCTPKNGGAWTWGSDTPKSATSVAMVERDMSRSAPPVLKPKFDWKEGDVFGVDGTGPYTVKEVSVRGVYAKNEFVSSAFFSWVELQNRAEKIA